MSKNRIKLDLGCVSVMGIINATPDSFSDGGKFFTFEKALQQANDLFSEGADILDVGGESTRPGAPDVSLEAEISRVIPLIEAIGADPLIDIPVSVDTSKVGVMAAAINAGATMVNDVRALQAPGAVELCAEAGVQVCLMHMQGLPRTMQKKPKYHQVVQDVTEFLLQRVDVCIKGGIAPENIVLDPGFGFGKTLEHNFQLLRSLDTLVGVGYPVLVGLSRKSLFGELLGVSVNDRLYASLAAVSFALQKGARIVRVHDVQATRHTVEVLKACNIFP